MCKGIETKAHYLDTYYYLATKHLSQLLSLHLIQFSNPSLLFYFPNFNFENEYNGDKYKYKCVNTKYTHIVIKAIMGHKILLSLLSSCQ